MLDLANREIPLKKQAELLNVNRTSAYYQPKDEKDDDIELMHRIDEIYTRWPHYGYRRITKTLREQNILVVRDGSESQIYTRVLIPKRKTDFVPIAGLYHH